jgi:CheY-like chemotaxis protein
MTRILLVDDNEMNLDMLSRRLERKGFQVLPVADGRAALEVARQQALDLILLDMSLPEMSGCEVASALKSLSPRMPASQTVSARLLPAAMTSIPSRSSWNAC